MSYNLRRKYYSLFYVRLPDYIYRFLSYRLQKYNILESKYNLFFIKDLEKLNQRRIDILNNMSKIKPNYNVCLGCNGLCCRGDYNHFFSLDYIIHLGSKNPLQDFKLIDNPFSPIALISYLNKLIKKDNKHLIWIQERALSGEKCPNWIEQMGCSFPINQKPMRCQFYTCPDYRNSFSDEDFKSFAILLGQLLQVAYKTYNLYCQATKKADNWKP